MAAVYWEDEEYKEAIKEYSYYSQMCQNLNEYDSKNRVFINKRDEALRKSHDIMIKYNGMNQ